VSDKIFGETQVRRIGAILFLFALLQAAVSGAWAQELKKVVMLPQWLPQAQFAGYMLAVEKGFYREAGLDVDLLRGGPDKPPFHVLETGGATFCTDWLSNAIQKRAAGLRVVNVGQIIQRSALLLVAKKKSGILRPEDLNGKKVGVWAGQFYLQPVSFFRKYGLNVNVVPCYSSMGLFLKGGVDANTAMWYNEYHTLLNSGLDADELTAFFFADLGLNFPEDGIYCTQDTFESDPTMCAAFLQASLKGWLYAFEHKEEALQIVMKHADAANTGANKAHQRWMLDRMQDLILPGDDRAEMGKLKPGDYASVGEVLLTQKLIGSIPPFDQFYRGPK